MQYAVCRFGYKVLPCRESIEIHAEGYYYDSIMDQKNVPVGVLNEITGAGGVLQKSINRKY